MSFFGTYTSTDAPTRLIDYLDSLEFAERLFADLEPHLHLSVAPIPAEHGYVGCYPCLLGAPLSIVLESEGLSHNDERDFDAALDSMEQLMLEVLDEHASDNLTFYLRCVIQLTDGSVVESPKAIVSKGTVPPME